MTAGDGYRGYRLRLVETLRERGIESLRVLHAVSEVPRHHFVPESVRHRAYEDAAVPIGGGQTISRPWVQARACELLELREADRVLEVGTGSGYQTALLARLAGSVFTIERLFALSQAARAALLATGHANVSFLVGDGSLGWRAWAPYDKIVVAAASPEVPAPLVEQLAVGGRMVVPVGSTGEQVLTLVERLPDGVRTTAAGDVRFVPLLGEHGF